MGIIRKTQSLDRLLKEFENEVSAISVIELIKRLDSQMNKTTIYRVLDKLEDDAVLHSFDCVTLELNLPKIPGREIFSSHILIQGRCELCSV